jgi:hypothetical protein
MSVCSIAIYLVEPANFKIFGVKVKVLHLKAVRVLAVQSLHPVHFNWFFPGKRVQNKLIDNDDPFGLVPVTIANNPNNYKTT